MVKKLCIVCVFLAVSGFCACGNGSAASNEEMKQMQTETEVSETSAKAEQPAVPVQPENSDDFVLKINVGEHEFCASFEDNQSAEELKELLTEGPVTVQMEDYGGFEKVGPLGTELTRSDEQITTQSGDVILYQGNQIVIYYGTNSWNFTRLARINDPENIKEKLGEGTAEVIFSLEQKEN